MADRVVLVFAEIEQILRIVLDRRRPGPGLSRYRARLIPSIRPPCRCAAGRLFYERGVRGVGMAEVTREAAAARTSATPTSRATSADPRDALLALVGEVAERAQDPRFNGCPFRNYLREFGPAENEAGRAAVAWLGRSRQRVEDLVREAGVSDPDSVADQIWLVLDGLDAGLPLVDPRRSRTAALAMVRGLLGLENVG